MDREEALKKIEALEAIEKAATSSPWSSDTESTHDDYCVWGPKGEFVSNVGTNAGNELLVAFDISKPNARAIAAARTALPVLLSIVRRMMKLHEQGPTWEYCANCEGHWPCPEAALVLEELSKLGEGR